MLLCVVMEVVANSYEGLMAGTRIGKERKRKRARRAGIPHPLFIWRSYGFLIEYFVPSSVEMNKSRELSVRGECRTKEGSVKAINTSD